MAETREPVSAAGPELPPLGASNRRLRLVRQLEQKKHREAHGLTVLEGLRLCQTAAEAGAVFRTLLCTREALGAGAAPLARACLGQGAECFLVEDAVLARVSPSASPPGVLAVVEIPRLELPRPPFGPRDLFLGLDEVGDPGNLGVLIRGLDAAGFRGALLLGGADPWNPKCVRASMGSLFHVPVQAAPSPDAAETLEDFRHDGCRLISTGPRGGHELWQADLGGPALLLLGNEARGVRPELGRLADLTVSIPNFGRAESLNVAQAGTVFMFEMARQAQAAPPARRRPLPPRPSQTSNETPS